MVIREDGEVFIIGRYPPSLVLKENSSVLTALQGFNRRGVRHAVIVREGQRLRGLLSVRRIVNFLGGGEYWDRFVIESMKGNLYRALIETSVSNIMMEDPPYAVAGSTSLEEIVEKMMDRGIGALPVVTENGKVIGIVSERHIADLIADATMYVSVREIMSSPPITASLSTPLREILRLMTKNRIRRIPLLDDQGKLAGIVTIRDVIRFYASDESLDKITQGAVEEVHSTPVSLIASHHPLVIEANRDVSHALRLMRAHGIGSLPVLSAGELVGIITERDILTKLPKRIGVERFVDTIEARIFVGRVFF